MIIVEFWHWWMLAAALGTLDMVAQSGFFLWLGFAALAVGGVVAVWPDMIWQAQVALFACIAIAAVMLARLFLRFQPQPTDQPHLNRRGHQYIGQLIVLESAIVNGRGRAYVGDTLWTVEGSDLPAGETVKVVGTDGVLLQVERLATTGRPKAGR